MAETNGHAAGDLPAPDMASAADLDALLAGTFEPVQFEVSPGRMVEIRPLLTCEADDLYGGKLRDSQALQRFLIGRCVYLNGKRLGELVTSLPIAVFNRLQAEVMRVNGMDVTPPETGDGAAEPDPKA